MRHKQAFAASAMLLGLAVLGGTAGAQEAFDYQFSTPGTLTETRRSSDSPSPYWWLRSGGRLLVGGGTGTTITGDLPENDPLRAKYAAAAPKTTDGGRHPQNSFRLFTKSKWKNSIQSIEVELLAANLSEPANRHAFNGVSLVSRYDESDANYYVATLRMDGKAVIKKKSGDNFYTLVEKTFLPGTYSRDGNYNLLTINKPFRLRLETGETAAGQTALKFWVDRERDGNWQLAADVVDNGRVGGAALVAAGANGVLSDFMDVRWDNYQVAGVATVTPPAPVKEPETPSTPKEPTAPAEQAPEPTPSGNPLAGKKLYVNPNSDGRRQAEAWRSSRPADAAIMEKLGNVAIGSWFGDWNSNVESDARNLVLAASREGAVPLLVAYNIPQRDCGSYSAGGANNPEGYRSWINNLARGIGNGEAVVILEPDALAGMTCLSEADQAARMELLKYAVGALKANPKTYVYVDAGNANWVPAGEMASRLKRADIARADGFAVNVSNFYETARNVSYGEAVSKETGGKHFIIDTSRNGAGSPGGEWCNPGGRALGQTSTTNTGNRLVDAFYWVKPPGQSDGTCNGGPSAGVWWPEYALELAKRAGW
nr:cellulase [uncultured bacterium]